MPIIVRHPELDGNRWTKVVVGQGGALIRLETYQIVPDILHEDCEQIGEGLSIAGGEWLTSPRGTLYRSAGIHIEGNGSMVGLLVIGANTGLRRRLGPSTMRSMRPVRADHANNMLGSVNSAFEEQLQERSTCARVALERAEQMVATYRATVEIQNARAANERVPQPATPVHDEQVWTVDTEAAPLAFTTESSQEVSVTLNQILRQHNESPSEPFRGTVRRRRW